VCLPWWVGYVEQRDVPPMVGGREAGTPTILPGWVRCTSSPFLTVVIVLLPGYTQHAPRSSWLGVTVVAGLGVAVTGRVALFLRIPWVKSLCASQGPKGVIVSRKLCAELLRFSREKGMHDRIDTGSPPMYSP